MEGNCAEDIAKAAFVSISTVRSQIKAISQKLGVNSQLAAVAISGTGVVPPEADRNPSETVEQPAQPSLLTERGRRALASEAVMGWTPAS